MAGPLDLEERGIIDHGLVRGVGEEFRGLTEDALLGIFLGVEGEMNGKERQVREGGIEDNTPPREETTGADRLQGINKRFIFPGNCSGRRGERQA
jgi:hypothetical protein